MLIVISVTQHWKYLQTRNFPPYVNYMYTGRMSRFLATYETETNISSVSVPVSKMQTLFQRYSLQPKPEYTLNVFDTNIYSNVLIST